MFPTKSGVYGMICAAFGHDRGSENEQECFKKLNNCSFLFFMMPRINREDGHPSNAPLILRDFHTASNTVNTDGKKLENPVVSNRFYLQDVMFGAIIHGDSQFMKEIFEALEDPVYPIYLGRKACVPTHPLTIGEYNEKKDAFLSILKASKFSNAEEWSLNLLPYQEDVKTFSEGTDTLLDVPVSFGLRTFTVRRVKTHFPKNPLGIL